jgi:hypothetical protein
VNDWAVQELQLLHRCWPNLVHAPDTHWCLLAGYAVPPGWDRQHVDLAFQLPAALPGQEPYGFLVRDGLTLAAGRAPTNYTYPAETTPWGGTWGKFSWCLAPWAPGWQPGSGISMVDFVRSIAARLQTQD